MKSFLNFYNYPSSEHYMVSWTDKGVPKDLDKLHNMSCLFTVSLFFTYIVGIDISFIFEISCNSSIPAISEFIHRYHLFDKHYFLSNF